MLGYTAGKQAPGAVCCRIVTLHGGLWRDRTSWRKSAQAVAVRAKPRRAKGGGAVARFAADIPELQGSMRVELLLLMGLISVARLSQCIFSRLLCKSIKNRFDSRSAYNASSKPMKSVFNLRVRFMKELQDILWRVKFSTVRQWIYCKTEMTIFAKLTVS